MEEKEGKEVGNGRARRPGKKVGCRLKGEKLTEPYSLLEMKSKTKINFFVFGLSQQHHGDSAQIYTSLFYAFLFFGFLLVIYIYITAQIHRRYCHVPTFSKLGDIVLSRFSLLGSPALKRIPL